MLKTVGLQTTLYKCMATEAVVSPDPTEQWDVALSDWAMHYMKWLIARELFKLALHEPLVLLSLSRTLSYMLTLFPLSLVLFTLIFRTSSCGRTSSLTIVLSQHKWNHLLGGFFFYIWKLVMHTLLRMLLLRPPGNCSLCNGNLYREMYVANTTCFTSFECALSSIIWFWHLLYAFLYWNEYCGVSCRHKSDGDGRFSLQFMEGFSVNREILGSE